MTNAADEPVHIVVTCTNRKRYPVPPQLRISNLAHLRPGTRFNEWTARLADSSHSRYPAADLYAGEHWQVAQKLTEALAAKTAVLWIASAGYGLVAADTAVCAYGATFSASAPDAVGASLADVTDWWRRLGQWPGPARESPRTFADLARRNPQATIVAVLSEAYQRACVDDLLTAAAVLGPEALSVVGPPDAQPRLTDLLVPVTAPMRHTVGGSLQALNVRVARHLLEHSVGLQRAPLREAAVATIPRGHRPLGRLGSVCPIPSSVRTSRCRRTPAPPTCCANCVPPAALANRADSGSCTRRYVAPMDVSG
ncbi:hypothetical protein Phou_091770 [Phytohabitans houttuyneae]|uniref:Uncharacterized protein n=1 Tax=Phytohabitans houttuyneae TaxID=1076126 RepID=A0A6V8KT54_9ACTN|nr:hypothetical protein Phou_091770 [Phytohabitans houttuyneae]